MDNRRQVPPEPAVVSVVVAVVIAVSAVVAAIVIRRRIGRLRADMHAARARMKVAQDRVPPNVRRLRSQLEHEHGWVVRRSANLAAVDGRLDAWLATLESGRTAIERINVRRLVPVARLARLLETVARYAVLWRNPLG